MDTLRPYKEQCAQCPNRTRLSQFLARIAGTPKVAGDCPGPTIISRGKIVTLTREPCDPAPPAHMWHLSTYSLGDGVERYSKVVWAETVPTCGREATPQESEVPYDGEGIFTDTTGQRRMAFVSGTPQELDIFRATQALRHLDG